jgi:acyl-CoA synthetase (AMP-forming)/AMP-acid ligase II
VVPTMLARLTEHLGDRVPDTPALRSLAYGGARMPRPVLERALNAFPAVGFTNAYGLTETSSTIAVLTPEDHRVALASSDQYVAARLGSVGRAVPGVEITVRAAGGGAAPDGDVGEIFVRGPQVSGTYANTGSALDARGWFSTKDHGRLDAEGYLYLEGRMDDTIIRGGENIAPAEIEDVLVRLAHVRECAVFGAPDDEWGERLAAAIVIEPGHSVTADEVRSFVRSRLRSSRTPDDVWFVTELPYTPTGKLVRRDLVAAYLAERGKN